MAVRPIEWGLTLMLSGVLWAGAPETAAGEPTPPAAPVVPEPAPPTGPPGTVDPMVQPFDLDATRRMSVPVTIGGAGPFSFLVDTGAERTVIARELAARLDLAQGAELRLATIAGSASAPSFKVASLEMAELRLNPFEAPALAGRHIGAAGLLGVDMLQRHRVLIDFRKQTMEVSETRRRARPIIRDDDAIVVEARNMAGRLILSDARVAGRRVDVIIDTGAQTSVGNLALRDLVRREKQHTVPFFPTVLTGVTGEDIAAERTALRRIIVEGADVNDLPISFADAQAFRALKLDKRPALLMGMDALRLFDRVEIDFPNRRIIFDLPDGAARTPLTRMAMRGGIAPGS